MVRNKGSPTTLEVGKICQTQPPNSQEAARHVLHIQAAPPTLWFSFFSMNILSWLRIILASLNHLFILFS